MMDAAATLYWTKVAALGQVAGAVATAAAVVVSLWLALSDRSAKLKVSAGVRVVVPGDLTPSYEIIAVKVENVGSRLARIRSVGWRTGWLNRGPKWAKRQWAVQLPAIGSPQTPYDLEPGRDVLFFVHASEFMTPDSAQRDIQFFMRKVPWKTEPVPAAICAVISVVGATDYYQKVDTSFAEYVAHGRKLYGLEVQAG